MFLLLMLVAANAPDALVVTALVLVVLMPNP
jgi:hypothetical protein